MSFALTNCNIVDVDNNQVQDNHKILIQNELITEVTSDNVPGSTVENTIDMQGFYILPGLFNVHNNLSNVFPFKDTDTNESPAETVLRCHMAASKALEAGVTTLRTMGEMNRADIFLKKMINRGSIPGPRILAAGKGLGVTGGHGSGFGQVEVDGAEEFRKAARRELSYGADHLKIFITGGIANKEETFEEPQMTIEEMQAVVSAAKAKGTYVAAHAGSSKPIIEAVKAGVHSIEHGYILNEEAINAMKLNSCFLVPTLSVTRSPIWMKEHHFEPWTIEKSLSAGRKHLESAKAAIKAGVPIACGTDLPPGDLNDGTVTTVKEIEFLTEAGLSNIEAIRAATCNAAKLCRIANYAGQIRPGYVADLIAVPENPISDIKSLERISFVMKGGKRIRDDLRVN